MFNGKKFNIFTWLGSVTPSESHVNLSGDHHIKTTFRNGGRFFYSQNFIQTLNINLIVFALCVLWGLNAHNKYRRQPKELTYTGVGFLSFKIVGGKGGLFLFFLPSASESSYQVLV